MARLARVCVPDVPHHIIQRGNNRQACFAAQEDFSAYAFWLAEFAVKNHVAVHAGVFMTNHVHLLVTPNSEDGIFRLMQSLGRCYVRYFNDTYCRSGTLWEGRFKSCVINAQEYLLTCQRYIELNPVRAGMVSNPVEYPWSSYQAHGLGKEIAMWQPHSIYMQLGTNPAAREEAYRELFRAHIDDEALTTIREMTNKGLALGNESFKKEIEQLTGRRVIQRNPGPRSNNSE